MKEGYYFPHFSNARHDRKVQRMMSELGIEGYGIFFMLLELLRDQHDLTYPMEDIDLLARQFGTSEQKVRVVICNYGLFEVDERQMFFSPKLIVNLEPFFRAKTQRKEAIESRWAREREKKSIESQSDSKSEIRPYNDRTSAEIQRKEKKSKEEKSKVKESKEENTGFDFRLRLLSFGLDVVLVDDFLKIRAKKKAVNSESAFNLLLKEIEKSGKSVQEVIELCVLRNWQSFKSEWAMDVQTRNSEKKESFMERQQREFDEIYNDLTKNHGNS